MFAADLQTDLPKSTKTKNMKKNLLTLATILTIGFFTNNVNAQATDEVTATSGATIVTPISISVTETLQFGSLVSGISGGKIKLGSDGILALPGGSVVLIASTLVEVPEFTVNGGKDRAFTITLPTDLSNQTVTHTDGATTMALSKFETASALSTSLDTDGKKTFKVGATLELAANQTAGVYTGSFPVSVDYN